MSSAVSVSIINVNWVRARVKLALHFVRNLPVIPIIRHDV